MTWVEYLARQPIMGPPGPIERQKTQEEWHRMSARRRAAFLFQRGEMAKRLEGGDNGNQSRTMGGNFQHD